MSVRFASLGSGSNGNSTLIRVDDTLLLIDVGFSAREIEKRLALLSVSAADISAILVSHEHSDHVKGLAVMARKHHMPVWLTQGTYRRLRDTKFDNVEFLHPHGSFCIGDAKITPFPVPHDAAEPCQFIVGDGARKIGIATDMGIATPHVCAQLIGLDALLIEANYDDHMLETGPYPYRLRQRIAGSFGHLSNHQSAALLASVEHGGLQHVLLGHLSENNNTPVSAFETVATHLSKLADRLTVLDRHSTSPWMELA